ncbi:MAG: metallophosphatase family protein [Nevskia sp.]|jgi:hypothetical protein|nr:metallophosphatase family protein [Nevskia sp.]MCK9385494.1 metallophosphatase family protein [Nevskia sp.]
MSESQFCIGLISDTHGLLRPQALAMLAGCQHILHGGDIGDPAILQQLSSLAPVTAVRGNNDCDAAYDAIPEAVTTALGGIVIHLLHDLKTLAIDPVHEGVQVVVSGHSHKPLIDQRGAVLYVNPGSAGPRRFSLPVSVARLWLAQGQPCAELLTLAV